MNIYLIFRREEFLKRILPLVDREKKLMNYHRNNLPSPSTKPHDTFQSQLSKNPEDKQRLVQIKKNFFVNSIQSESLPTALSLTNLENTVFSLALILSTIAIGVILLNDGKAIPLVNAPVIDVPGLIKRKFYDNINSISSVYNKIKNPFKGYEDNVMNDEDAFMCPIEKNDLKTISQCFFRYKDAVILNVLEAIPSYGTHLMNIFRDLWEFTAPEKFVVNDGINMALFIIQKFVALPKVITLEPTIIEPKNAEEDNARTKASFTFDPFPEDVINIRDSCLAQCNTQSNDAKSYLFGNIEVQSPLVSDPMTARDYIFNSISASTLYVCQYSETSNFGGTWLYFVDDCLCSDLCTTSDYFGFAGCADLLNRVGVACSTENPCTLERLCPYPSRRFEIKSSDQGSALYDYINTACLDVCAELAIGADFATLAALSGAGGALTTNLFGLLSNPFGTELGVPVSLLPGILYIALI